MRRPPMRTSMILDRMPQYRNQLISWQSVGAGVRRAKGSTTILQNRIQCHHLILLRYVKGYFLNFGVNVYGIFVGSWLRVESSPLWETSKSIHTLYVLRALTQNQSDEVLDKPEEGKISSKRRKMSLTVKTEAMAPVMEEKENEPEKPLESESDKTDNDISVSGKQVNPFWL